VYVRTNIDIDDDLLTQAAAIAGTKTKKSTVEWALKELIRQKAMRDLAAMRGAVDIDADDVRPGRKRSTRSTRSGRAKSA
jgi:Arc/MetJ family transcription regulator